MTGLGEIVLGLARGNEAVTRSLASAAAAKVAERDLAELEGLVDSGLVDLVTAERLVAAGLAEVAGGTTRYYRATELGRVVVEARRRLASAEGRA